MQHDTTNTCYGAMLIQQNTCSVIYRLIVHVPLYPLSSEDKLLYLVDEGMHSINYSKKAKQLHVGFVLALLDNVSRNAKKKSINLVVKYE